MKIDATRERARHNLDRLIEETAVYHQLYGGHFQAQWDAYRKNLGAEGWRMDLLDVTRVGEDYKQSVKAKQYVGAFIEILAAMVMWEGSRPSEAAVRSFDKIAALKTLNDALNEGSDSLRREVNNYVPTSNDWRKVWRKAAEHVLGYINASLLCGPIHRTCVICGKLTMPRDGTPGKYCGSPECRKAQTSTRHNPVLRKKRARYMKEVYRPLTQVSRRKA